MLERLSKSQGRPTHELAGFHIVENESDHPDGLTQLGALQVDAVVMAAAQQARLVQWQDGPLGNKLAVGEEVGAEAVIAALALQRHLETGE
jgi:hypothetical protein